MNEKFNEAIKVCTSLMKRNNKYLLSFTCVGYEEDKHFRIIIDQDLCSGDNLPHRIVIDWIYIDDFYEVWSNQFVRYKVQYFVDATDMHKYIQHLLELYSNKPIN